MTRPKAPAKPSAEPPHTCHWPGCTKHVPPRMWGCRPHWFTLPRELRDKIWAAYVEGQEITKTPSNEYLEVAREADVYARFYESQRRPRVAPQTSLF